MEHKNKPVTAEEKAMDQLADDAHRQQLAHAQAQRPAERVLALARATRRAERAERRMRRAARQARRLRTQLQAQTASNQ